MKYRVRQRDNDNPAKIEEVVIEFEGTAIELSRHAHIVEVLEVVEEEKKKEIKPEVSKKESK